MDTINNDGYKFDVEDFVDVSAMDNQMTRMQEQMEGELNENSVANVLLTHCEAVFIQQGVSSGKDIQALDTMIKNQMLDVIGVYLFGTNQWTIDTGEVDTGTSAEDVTVLSVSADEESKKES